jgi:hypothetical protein
MEVRAASFALLIDAGGGEDGGEAEKGAWRLNLQQLLS